MTAGEAVGIPSRPEALDAAWMTEVLRGQGALSDQAVVDVAFEPCGTGQLGDCYRLTLTYDRPPPPDAPTRLVGKFPAQDEGSRTFGRDAGLYAREVGFYQRLAEQLDIRTPRPYYADMAAGTGEFLLLVEDLGPADEADQLTGCSPAAAALAVDQAAALHGSSWDRPDLLDDEAVPTAEGYAVVAEMMPDLVAAFRERYETMLEERYLAVVDRMVGSLGPWARALQEPRCISHNDYRLDNMLFDGQAGAVPLTVVDWQTFTRGPGINDVSYFLGAGLDTASRRRHERELVARYDAAMRARGVERTWDEWWTGYRRHAVMGLVTAIQASVSVERTQRGDEMFLTMARRHIDQMLDHDTLGLLGA